MGQGSGVSVSCGVDRRCGSYVMFLWLWLWGGLAAAALIQPLAWELPCAAPVVLESKKKKKIDVEQS